MDSCIRGNLKVMKNQGLEWSISKTGIFIRANINKVNWKEKVNSILFRALSL
jgi:hypothetical protein